MSDPNPKPATQQPTFPHFSDKHREVGAVQMLHQIPDRVAEALLTADSPNPSARSARSVRRPESPALANLDVIDALRPDPDGLAGTVHGEIAQAVRAVWEDHRHVPLPEVPTIASDCGWLITHAHLWQDDPFLSEFVTDSVATAHRRLEHLCRVEKELPMVCTRLGCKAKAHMQPGGQWLMCESGHSLDVNAERGRWLSMQDWTLTETASALRTYLGQEVPLNTLKTWAKRGRILPVDERRPQRFNFGAVCRALERKVG